MNKEARSFKPRNPDLTKQFLLNAVGQILKDKGHTGLGVNRIANIAGVNKKMIYWYYSSYNNLLKAYIKGKDFWKSRLSRFSLSTPPRPEEVPAYINSIFQEQFKSFHADKELQNMILWQITQSNPLLREISEEREAEADPIAALTDAHFKDSNINFRAVLALILGGIYYVVWHSSNNKSRICGIDINCERDQVAFQNAIQQVIDAVWKAADEKKSQ